MRVNLFLEDSPNGFDFFKQLKCLRVMAFWVIPEEVQLDARWDVYYSRAWVILILSLELFLYVSDQGMDSLKGHE